MATRVDGENLAQICDEIMAWSSRWVNRKDGRVLPPTATCRLCYLEVAISFRAFVNLLSIDIGSLPPVERLIVCGKYGNTSEVNLYFSFYRRSSRGNSRIECHTRYTKRTNSDLIRYGPSISLLTCIDVNSYFGSRRRCNSTTHRTVVFNKKIVPLLHELPQSDHGLSIVHTSVNVYLGIMSIWILNAHYFLSICRRIYVAKVC